MFVNKIGLELQWENIWRNEPRVRYVNNVMNMFSCHQEIKFTQTKLLYSDARKVILPLAQLNYGVRHNSSFRG